MKVYYLEKSRYIVLFWRIRDSKRIYIYWLFEF